MIKRLLVTWQHPETNLFEKGAILVNRDGARFTDETAQPELAIPQQPDKIAYIVMDKALADVFSEWPNFVSTAPDIAYAYIQDYRRLRSDVYAEGATLEELAERIGADPEVLNKAIRDYNTAVAGGCPDRFARTRFDAPVAKPPFIALGPVKSWIVTTEGGLRVNERLEVLDTQGAVIPGLYAGGCNGMGGIIMWSHGCHIAWAITSGRLAGQNAAKR